MNVARPHRAVVAGLDGDVLVLLAGTNRPMSGREVAERLGLRSHDGVRKSLERLVEQGIVIREGSRSAYMHVLNREHLGAPAVLALAGMRNGAVGEDSGAIEAWAVRPLHASVFGSAARGDGNEDSDIDVFLVRPATVTDDDPRWTEQIESLRARIEAWTGNPASIVEQGEDELRERFRRDDRPAALLEIQDQAIDLVGIPARRLSGILDGA
jgi:predicted nucleotidyltransferase/biotin operon repressor